MTEQYRDRTINQEGNFRRVTSADVDPTLVTPAVVLGVGDQFVVCDGGVAFQVNLPPAEDACGIQFVIKAAPTLAAPVTIASAEIAGVNTDTFDGALSPLGILLVALMRTVVQGDTPLAPIPPAIVGIPSTNWAVVNSIGLP